MTSERKELGLKIDSEVNKHLKEQFDLEQKLYEALKKDDHKTATEILDTLKAKFPYFDINHFSEEFDPKRMLALGKLKQGNDLTLGDIFSVKGDSLDLSLPISEETHDYIQDLVDETREQKQDENETIEQTHERVMLAKINPDKLKYDSLELTPFLNKYLIDRLQHGWVYKKYDVIYPDEYKQISPDIVRLLLENGADPNRYSKLQHATPLMILDSRVSENLKNREDYIKNMIEILNILTEYKCDINNVKKAFMFKDIKLFNWFLSQGVEIKSDDYHHFNAQSLGFENSTAMKEYVSQYYKDRIQTISDVTGFPKELVNLTSEYLNENKYGFFSLSKSKQEPEQKTSIAKLLEKAELKQTAKMAETLESFAKREKDTMSPDLDAIKSKHETILAIIGDLEKHNAVKKEHTDTINEVKELIKKEIATLEKQLAPKPPS